MLNEIGEAHLIAKQIRFWAKRQKAKGKLGNPLQNLVLMSEDRFKISKEYVNTYCIVNKPALSTVANKHKIKLPEKYFNKELLNFFWF